MDNLLLTRDNKNNAIDKEEYNLSYWQRKLGGDIPELNLPFDFAKNANRDIISHTYKYALSSQLNKQINAFLLKENISSYVFFMTIFKILMFRYSGESDITVGTSTSSETGNNKDQTNILVLRSQLYKNMTFLEAVQEVNKVTQEAHNYVDVPFENFLNQVSSEFPTNRNPFYQVMMNMDEVQFNKGLYPVELNLSVIEEQNNFRCCITYDFSLFNEETIIRMEGHFKKLIEGCILNPQTSIGLLPLLTDLEKHKLLVEWNSAEVDYPSHMSISELFEEQVELHSEDIALIYREEAITYKELNKRANQLANFLRKQNIVKEELVAICLDRSIDLIVSFLGVLKAGCAYVPIDLSYPKERIEYMLRDSKASFVITQESIGRKLPHTDSKYIFLDQYAREISSQSDKSIICSGPENLAYVMYTSGSTGDPKGVAIIQRGVARLVKNIDYGKVGPEEIYLNLAQVAFDLSVFEIYAPLLNGGKLVLAPSNKPTFEEVAKTISLNKVTSICVTPDRLNMLLEDHNEYLASLRQIYSAGEALPVWLAKKCLNKLENCKLINLYGPTENSVTTTSYKVNEEFKSSSIVLIGRPISSDKVYILDEFLQPVPIGVIGEIYMAGDGVAREYLNKEDLTLEKFPNDPFSNTTGRKLYKSGDLAKYLSDGNIEFIRRVDDQVKIRGYRIELGEIETVVGLHPSVRQAVASTFKANGGSTELVVYVVMNMNEKFNQQEIRSYLRERLPIHMVPSFLIELKEIPVTPVGKIDRKQLPSPTVSLEMHKTTLPRNTVETALVSIWESVLGYEGIGIRDNFFDLGGNSLLAMRLFSEIEKIFKKKLPVSIIFQEETIENLAKLILSNNQSERMLSSLVPIQPLGSKTPIFCVHGEGGEVLIYKELAVEFGNDQPVYGLRYVKNENSQATSVELLAEKYIKEIRELQPTGPYNLLGFCYGGAIAYEMAYKLIEDGHEVSMLTIINLQNPGNHLNQTSISNLVMNKFRRLHNMTLMEIYTLLNQKIRGTLTEPNNLVVQEEDQEHLKLVNLPYDTSYEIKAAVNNYTPKPYPGKMMLIRGINFDIYEEKLGWEHTKNGSVDVNRVFAPHEKILKKPNVELVVKQIKKHLAEKH